MNTRKLDIESLVLCSLSWIWAVVILCVHWVKVHVLAVNVSVLLVIAGLLILIKCVHARFPYDRVVVKLYVFVVMAFAFTLGRLD
jgi:hypothetical protein